MDHSMEGGTLRIGVRKAEARTQTIQLLSKTLCVVACLALSILGQSWAADQHTRRFQLDGRFVANVWKYPVQSLPVTIGCAGPVHDAPSDCELHVSALLDNSELSDFPHVVLEPPNICDDNSGTDWQGKINSLGNKHLNAFGVVRVWPEHLTSGQGCSNPNHFMELHPLLELRKGTHTEFSWEDRLYVPDGLGYKDPAKVHQMLGVRVWVRSSCKWTRPDFSKPAKFPPGSDDCMVDFDYGVPSKWKAGQLSNFARLRARIIPEWIRPKDDAQEERLKDFATVLARVTPVDSAGEIPDTPWDLVKLYGIRGSKFYDHLLSRRGSETAGKAFDVIGLFMVDPLNVVRALENSDYVAGEWIEVQFPVAVVAFGEVGGGD